MRALCRRQTRNTKIFITSTVPNLLKLKIKMGSIYVEGLRDGYFSPYTVFVGRIALNPQITRHT